VITSFADETTEHLFHGDQTHNIHKKLKGNLLKAAQRKLDILNSADSLETLSGIPSNKPDGAARDSHDSYSIPIDEGLSLAFRWDNGNALNVHLKT